MCSVRTAAGFYATIVTATATLVRWSLLHSALCVSHPWGTINCNSESTGGQADRFQGREHVLPINHVYGAACRSVWSRVASERLAQENAIRVTHRDLARTQIIAQLQLVVGDGEVAEMFVVGAICCLVELLNCERAIPGLKTHSHVKLI